MAVHQHAILNGQCQRQEKCERLLRTGVKEGVLLLPVLGDRDKTECGCCQSSDIDRAEARDEAMSESARGVELIRLKAVCSLVRAARQPRRRGW